MSAAYLPVVIEISVIFCTSRRTPYVSFTLWPWKTATMQYLSNIQINVIEIQLYIPRVSQSADIIDNLPQAYSYYGKIRNPLSWGCCIQKGKRSYQKIFRCIPASPICLQHKWLVGHSNFLWKQIAQTSSFETLFFLYGEMLWAGPTEVKVYILGFCDETMTF